MQKGVKRELVTDKVCKVEGASDAKDQVEKCLGGSTVISGQLQGCVFNFYLK